METLACACVLTQLMYGPRKLENCACVLTERVGIVNAFEFLEARSVISRLRRSLPPSPSRDRRTRSLVFSPTVDQVGALGAG